MRGLRVLTLLALAFAGMTSASACSSSGSTGGGSGAGGSSGSAGAGGASGGGGASGSGASSGTGGGVSCTQLGGSCQCAGGCNTGFHSAGEADCPQPCAGCGACSQWCCVPDVSDAGADGD